MKRPLALAALALVAPAASAQTLTYAGSLRVRQEVWDWFQPAGSFQNAYTFTGATLRYGATRATKRDVAALEIEAPALLGLPTRASAPAPQGGLGLGALYRSFNGAQNGSAFVKQAYWQSKSLGLRAGRFEFNDGSETAPTNPTLAWIKSQRVAQRLIGAFGWSHVGRSFDGVQLARPLGGDRLVALAASPTRGVFDLDGMETLSKVRFGYVSATRSRTTRDDRLFVIPYEDARPVAKVDNRGGADLRPLRLWTFGGHHAQVWGPWEALVWGAIQSGDWGSVRHDAHAYSVEAGYALGTVRLRAGYDVYSGDSNPADGKHQTFYPLLNTPRIYARTPFFAEANSRDLFVQALFKADPKTPVRVDLHRVRLDRSADRWYAAGGPFERSGSFGLIGRANPSGGAALADLIDISADRPLDARTSVSLYLGQMLGGRVVRGIYPDRNGLFGYAEVTVKL